MTNLESLDIIKVDFMYLNKFLFIHIPKKPLKESNYLPPILDQKSYKPKFYAIQFAK